jgi:hypothetical protein
MALLFDYAIASNNLHLKESIASFCASRIVHGELNTKDFLHTAERYGLRSLQAFLMYSVLIKLPLPTDKGVTRLSRPDGVTDKQYLAFYQGYVSLASRWMYFRLHPISFAYDAVHQDLVSQWNWRWRELAECTQISTYSEADVLGRLRFMEAALKRESWMEETCVMTGIRALESAIEDLENDIFTHF